MINTAKKSVLFSNFTTRSGIFQKYYNTMLLFLKTEFMVQAAAQETNDLKREVHWFST